LIEIFFPQTIDKLMKEHSDITGPKPILLENFEEKDLITLIIGRSSIS